VVIDCTDFGGWCKKWTIVNFRPNRSIHSYIFSSIAGYSIFHTDKIHFFTVLMWPYYPETWYQPCMSTLCPLLHQPCSTGVLDGITCKIRAQMFVSFHQKNLQFTDTDIFNLT